MPMRRPARGLIGIFVGLLAAAIAAGPAQGSARLDPSFGGGDGIVEHVRDGLSGARAVAEGPAGKLVVTGGVYDFCGTYLLRLGPGGGVDTSFGNQNGAACYVSKSTDAEELAIDRRGRVLVAGHEGRALSPRAPCATVTRYTRDGNLDESYGFFSSRFPGTSRICDYKNGFPNTGLEGRAISLTRRGKALVAGTSHKSFRRQGAMAMRLTRDGKPDRRLRGDRRTHTAVRGVVGLLPEAGHYGGFRDIKPLGGGKFLAGGYLTGRYMAARFNYDGSLDRSFGRHGVASFDLDGKRGCNCSYGAAMVRDYRGRILIAGYVMSRSDESAPKRLTVIRLRRNGRLDRSFGRRGVARPDVGEDVLPTEIVVQRDGRIVVSAQIDRLFGLVRFKQDGSLDRSFFGDGVFTDYVTGRFGGASDVLIDSQGRIVAAGGSEEGGFAVMRFLPR